MSFCSTNSQKIQLDINFCHRELRDLKMENSKLKINNLLLVFANNPQDNTYCGEVLC